MVKQRYLELAQDLFAREQHTGVYEETSIDQNYLEIEKQTTTRDGQPSQDHIVDVTQGIVFFVGDLEVSLVKQNN